MNQYITNVNFTRNSLVHIFLLPWSYFPACIWNSYDFDSFGWIPVSGVKRGSFGPEKNSGFSYLLISLKSAAPCFSSHHPGVLLLCPNGHGVRWTTVPRSCVGGLESEQNPTKATSRCTWASFRDPCQMVVTYKQCGPELYTHILNRWESAFYNCKFKYFVWKFRTFVWRKVGKDRQKKLTLKKV